MIIDQKKTTLAYRCPHCGSVPTSMVGAFSLSGNLFKLKCSCGESVLTVEKIEGDKLRLTVPCVVCPKPHSYIISNNVFFGSDIFVIPCSLSGIDICFIGGERAVADAVLRSNEEIMKSLGEAGIDEFQSEAKNDYDPALFDMVSYVISDLCEEGKIFCLCKEGEGEFLATVDNGCVRVECKKCGASTKIELRDSEAAHEFLGKTELHLK